MYRIVAARSAPLYHGTGWEEVISIIESNELRANVANETETYGVSLTRNKNAAYSQVSLVLDQLKLNQNYAMHPVFRYGIQGKDLAEERIDRTIHNIRKYIVGLRFNNQIYLKTLRRTIVQHFDEDDLLEQKYFPGRKPNMVYSINRVIECADKYRIPLDDTFKKCKKYIDMYKNRELDEEYKQILDAKAAKKRKSNL